LPNIEQTKKPADIGMKNSLKHPQEEQRISSLRKLKILDSLPEAEFDEITLIAAQVCKTPIAMISFIDDSRQWIKSRHGMILPRKSGHAFMQRLIV